MTAVFDDSELIKPIISPLCLICAHADVGNPVTTCAAFPSGIPQEILAGNFVHTKKMKDEPEVFKPINPSV